MLPTKWPQWIIISIAFLLVAAIIGLGLGLVMAVQASTPTMEALATPTPPAIDYAGPISTACTVCHTDKARLGETAVGEEEIQRLYIEPADTQVLHGRLGCVTCHRGTPDTEDAEAAHTGLVIDPSVDSMGDCLYCHSALPNEYPDDLLIAPHDQVVNGTAKDLACSDCHGSVGHGYDPVTGEVIISMSACLDCHEERQLEVQLEDCEACHTETPPWSPEADCSICHSLDSYTYEESLQNPDLLAYAHAQEGLTCLDCHEQTELEEVHVGAAPGAKVRPLKVKSEFCFGCHVENEHTSYDQVIELTADLEEEVGANPHDSHYGQIECRTCHKNHRESEDYCSECHQFEWQVP